MEQKGMKSERYEEAKSCKALQGKAFLNKALGFLTNVTERNWRVY